MKVLLNNLDTPFTICTYSMFTGDSTYDNEADYQKTENNNLDPNISFNHKEIVRDLAIESAGLLFDGLNEYEDTKGIVKSIKVVNTYSPKYYNYTTDSYDMQIAFNATKLNKYIKDNFLDGEVEAEFESLTSFKDTIKELYYIAKLIVLLGNNVDEEHYKYAMWESEYDIYSQNMTVETV